MNPIIGNVNPPPGLSRFGDITAGGTTFINIILNTLIVIAGLYAVFNIVLAGYAFMSAGDDPKKVAGAWAKIWQTILGLVIAAGALVLAAIFGKIIFGEWDALLKLRLFKPS